MQTNVRCNWCEKDDLYRHYHDTEWGKPSHDDHHLFEHLILETFQAGLSWHTIRSLGKINAVISNARFYLECVKEFGTFDNYIWQFTHYKIIENNWFSMKELPATSPESDAMSKDLKMRGFKYIGSTTCYAYMQSVGMVNDHLQSCFLYNKSV